MKKGLSPARLLKKSDEWNWRIKALCFWTRWETSRLRFSRSCCAHYKSVNFERLGSIHTRRVNIRLVAATNRDLEKMIAAREFRSDLYYRLHVFPIAPR